MRYLLITHIPYSQQPGGEFILDRLWAEDLKGLVNAVGPITIAAPKLELTALQAWGAGMATLRPEDRVSFVALPPRVSRISLERRLRLHSILRRAVDNADLIHTSNLFEPDTDLYFAHDYAVRRKKKTLFVVAEDFVDMLQWEWVRTAPNRRQRKRRQRTLHRQDKAVRTRVASASLTFLHTPAAVARYRAFAANAIAIRQPVHEREDVLSLTRLEDRLLRASTSAPLRLVAASRMQPLKGLDLLLRAIAILQSRSIPVEATLYGDGPQLSTLRALADRLNLSVTFPGPLAPASALREALADRDLFLMPHLTNDFGRAFFDAMAAALPVIAFRSPASQDTVRDTLDGLLAANADPESLADCIARFHQNRPLLAQASHAARLRALDNTKSFWSQYRAQLIHELFV